MDFQDYIIGDCPFRLMGNDLMAAVASMPGFLPFERKQVPDEIRALYHIDMTVGDEPMFSVKAGEEVPEVKKVLYTFEGDGVDSEFCRTQEGFLLRMERKEDDQLLLVWAEKGGQTVWLKGSYEPQLLRFALWMGYGMMTVYSGRIALHCSCIVKDEKAYIFLGESGTGKSTHTRLWRENIPDAHLLNDDSPILVAREEGVFVYGSPWSGKTPCYLQKHYPLGGVVRLSQAPYNKMEKLSHLKAFAAIHPSCPPDFAYDEYLYGGIVKTLNRVLTQVPFYHLACLPDRDAALLSYRTLTGQSETE